MNEYEPLFEILIFLLHVIYLQPLTAAKMENTKLNLSQPPPELQKRSNNTPSLESILKGINDQKICASCAKRAYSSQAH